MPQHVRACLILITLLVAWPARADEPRTIRWQPYVALLAGQTADVVSTHIAFSRGCVEGNAAYGSSMPSTAHLVATKVTIMAPIAIAMVVLQRHGHQQAATRIGYLAGGVGVGIAAWNLSLHCGS